MTKRKKTNPSMLANMDDTETTKKLESAKKSFIHTMVTGYAVDVNLDIEEVWHDMYSRLLYDYGVDVRKLVEISKSDKPLDALEEFGLLEPLNNVVRDRLGAFIISPYKKPIVKCPF